MRWILAFSRYINHLILSQQIKSCLIVCRIYQDILWGKNALEKCSLPSAKNRFLRTITLKRSGMRRDSEKMREKVLHSSEAHFVFSLCLACQKLRHQGLTETSVSNRASHISGAITLKGHAGWVCLSQRLRNSCPDAWKLIFFNSTTIVGFKFSQHHSPSLQCFPAWVLLFKLSVPTSSMQYPKRKTSSLTYIMFGLS